MFYILMVFVIIQRMFELYIARRNEKIMLSKGAYEVGASHYPIMIMLHVSFFLSLFIEVMFFNRGISGIFLYLFILFLLVQGLRIWCITSLGPFWNTKIIILPGANVVKKGPYKLFRHPNYLIVSLEIILISFMFQAYFTGILFTILNLLMLSVRIPIEEKALMRETNYKEQFKKKFVT